jgi:hypothetical protein
MKNGLLWGIIGVCALLIASNSATAFDYTGRIDTRYKLQIGDNATDNDIYQYHFFNLLPSERWSIEWYGQLRKDLDGYTDEAPAGDEEKTDAAFRGLSDAVNLDQTWEYRIYKAYVQYNTEKIGGLIGRTSLDEYEYSQVDGIMLWGTPVHWLRLEGFGGKPWHYYNYINNSDDYWIDGEYTLGAGADFLLYDQRLNFYVRYLYLRETTQSNALISEPEDTYLSDDHVSKLRVNYFHEYWLRTGLAMSFLNIDPRDIHIWANGTFDQILLSYYVEYYTQFIDINDLGDSLTKFSALLTASHPYMRFTADISQSFANILNLSGALEDLELQFIYEHRQPIDSANESQFNPTYNMFNIGTIFAFRNYWYFMIFFEYIKTTGLKNDIATIGGEVAKKWDKLKLQLGSSYYVSKYETDYTQTIIEDSFYAQEYYFRSKWKATKSLDVSFKTSFEVVKLTSLTSTDKVNDAVVYEPITTIIDDPRYYVTFDIRVGYNF